jgi:hypothetical protein
LVYFPLADIQVFKGKNPISNWTNEEALVQVKSMCQVLKREKRRSKIIDAFDKQKADGRFLARLTTKSNLKSNLGKILNVGELTEFWKVWKIFVALPIEESLYQVLAKCLSRNKSVRYTNTTEVIAALHPLQEREKQMLSLEVKIPTKVEQKVDELSKAAIFTNIGWSLMNHGYISRATSLFEKRAQTNTNDQVWASVCWCHSHYWKDEGQCSTLCDTGVEKVIDKCIAEMSAEGMVCVHSLSALTLLCMTNGGHVDKVADNKNMMELLLQILDGCCGDVGAMCMGLCCCLHLKHYGKLVELGIIKHVPTLLRRHATNQRLVILSASLLIYISARDATARAQLVNGGAVDALAEAWRQHHSTDARVSHLVSFSFYWLTIGHTQKLIDIGVAELTFTCLESLEKSDIAVAAQEQLQLLLWGLACNGGQLGFTKELLEKGMDKDITDSWVWGTRNPMVMAAQHGHAEVVQALLEAGAITDVKCEGGKTALEFAQDAGHNEVVKILQGSKKLAELRGTE